MDNKTTGMVWYDKDGYNCTTVSREEMTALRECLNIQIEVMNDTMEEPGNRMCDGYWKRYGQLQALRVKLDLLSLK